MDELSDLFSRYGEQAYIHAKRLYIPKFMADQNSQVARAVADVLPKGGTVIYPGSGTGIVLQLLFSIDDTLTAVGFDNAEGMITKARETTDDRITYLVGDVLSPPCHLQGCADVVLLKNSMYFLDPSLAVPAVASMIKQGGYFIFTTYKEISQQDIKNRLWGTAFYDTQTRPKEEYERGEITKGQLDEVTTSVDLEVFYQTQLLPFLKPPVPLGELAELMHANSFRDMLVLDLENYADTMYLIRGQMR